MSLLLLREIIVIAATAVAAYTDWKTGFIYDKLTYPLIALGVLFNLLEFELFGFLVAVGVFLVGYLLYYTGKLGGGDVKLFVGIAFIMPMVKVLPFVLHVVVAGGMIAMVVLGVYYVSKYVLRKGINFRENMQGIITSFFIGAAVLFYMVFISTTGLLQFELILTLAVALFCGLFFMAFERGIRKEFFLRKVRLEELEEDDLIAAEFMDLGERKKIGMKLKGIIGEKEKERLEELGIKEVQVYRDLPKFAPFVFIGTVICVGLVELGII